MRAVYVNQKSRYLYLGVSFLLIASAQPDWSVGACILASCFGFALFWKGLLNFSSRKARFWVATLWFALIQAFHFSWFLSDRYVGGYIYPFLSILYLGLGLQFGLLSILIPRGSKLSYFRLICLSSLWVILEWSRLHILSGFSWNPVGIALTSTLYGIQFTSLFGVFGLSFWVIGTNLLALKFLLSPSRKRGINWGVFALIPYLFGVAHLSFFANRIDKSDGSSLSILLVQPSLSPEEKYPMEGTIPLSPDLQWERILSMLASYKDSSVDLLVLPEAVVPYGADNVLYSSNTVRHAFTTLFGDTRDLIFEPANFVGNSYWMEKLADFFEAEVIVGLEDMEFDEEGSSCGYNAAFCFHPSKGRERYEKRVLVPMGEYIPFSWCKKILSKYGISDSFVAGKQAKVFSTKKASVGVSICYEETYGELMRANRLQGADLLVNLTNDGWYPRSRLPYVHYFHGKLRALEGGIPLVRCCNTGVTCGVDAFGRDCGMLPYDSKKQESAPGILAVDLPLFSYATLYSRFGDKPVLFLSFASLICYSVAFLTGLFKSKQLKIKDLNIYLLKKN
ncbi:MAG: Apolipoprotein N-acyltransferase [Chlamydiae bacterium]|nr:Apolipoprotein N-acyltransferase [Chlamydiota bacterium]